MSMWQCPLLGNRNSHLSQWVAVLLMGTVHRCQSILFLMGIQLSLWCREVHSFLWQYLIFPATCLLVVGNCTFSIVILFVWCLDDLYGQCLWYSFGAWLAQQVVFLRGWEWLHCWQIVCSGFCWMSRCACDLLIAIIWSCDTVLSVKLW